VEATGSFLAQGYMLDNTINEDSCEYREDELMN